MKDLTFPEKEQGNQTPMLREQSRTPIHNKISMSQDYQSWLTYKQNVSNSKQSIGTNQQQKAQDIYTENKVNFKRKIENENNRIIFCVDRNAVNVQPLKYTTDTPMVDLCDQDDSCQNLFINYQSNRYEPEISQGIQIQKINELQPDEEDMPFENYEDFLIEDTQNQNNLNAKIQQPQSIEQTQITQKIALNTNDIQHQQDIFKNLNNNKNKGENVIIMLPKTSREEVIQNKIQTNSVYQNQIENQQFQDYSTQYKKPQFKTQNKIEKNELYQSNQQQHQKIEINQQTDKTKLIEDKPQSIQLQQNYQENYQQQLLQSDDQYDPVQSILNKYQYKGDEIQQKYQNQINHEKILINEPIQDINPKYQYKGDHIQQSNSHRIYQKEKEFNEPIKQQTHSHNQLNQQQQNTTRKFVVIDGQRIPYDEYYKNQNIQKIVPVQQYDQPKVYYKGQEDIIKNEQLVQNQDKNIRKKKVSFQEPEIKNVDIQKPNNKIIDETEKIKRLQYIKEQLKKKEQEQAELNSRIKNIYGELEQEQVLQKSIEQQEQSLVEELNMKSEQIEKLRQQNDQLRQKITHHYTDLPTQNNISNQDNVNNKIVDIQESNKLNTIKEEINEENNSIPQFNTFADSKNQFYQGFSNSKKKDYSPTTNLRRTSNLIPSQTIPKDYRTPYYDSVDQQQFSKLQNQSNQYQKSQINYLNILYNFFINNLTMQFENSKILLKLFVFIFFLVQISHQNFKCNQDLLLSYGLKGFETSQKIKFEMCSFISYNCCRNEDQMKIFQNWVIDGELMNLNKRFEFYKKVYSNLMQQLNELNLIAFDMDATLNKVKVSNCKIMAFRYQQFKIKDVSKNFLTNLDKLYKYYKLSVQGFYCSLCDGKLQNYYNKHQQEIIVSKKFGREFLENSLSPLLYIHLHFAHFLNLSSRYIQNCDINGTYKDSQISEQLRFGIDPNISKMLNSCRQNRNVPQWLNFCKDVIAKFHPTKIQNFLTGDIKKLNNFVLFLKEDITKYRDAQEAQRKKLQGQKNKKRSLLLSSERLLETQTQEKQKTQSETTPEKKTDDTKKDTTSTKDQKTETKKEEKKPPVEEVEEENLLDQFLIEAEEFENFYEDEEIIQPALNGVYSVEDFKIVVQDDGIHYQKIGKETIIDDKVIMLIRNNNKQQIVAQEKKIEKEEKLLEEIQQKNKEQKVQQPAQETPTQETQVQTPQESRFRLLKQHIKKRVL